MKFYHRIMAMVIAFCMLLGSACAQGIDSKWTLGNIHITLDDQEYSIAPDARLEVLKDENALKMEFGMDMNGRTLLPASAEISQDGIYFSLGSRVYSLDMDAIIDDLDLTDEEKSMLSHLGETIQSASALIGKNTTEYLRENDEIFNRMYEILLGANAEETQVTVGETQLAARKYAGDIKPVHLVDLFNYIRGCNNEEIALFGQSLLKLVNLGTGKDYISFTSHYYDGVFGDPANNEPLAEAEIIFGYNDDLIYEKTTCTITEPEDEEEQSGSSDTVVNERVGGKSILVSESITTGEGTVSTTTETYTAENSNSSTHTVMEMDGPVGAPTAIRLNIESDSGYTQENEPANLTLTVREVLGFSFDAACADGMWSASFTGDQDTAAAYDYGDGPVVINDALDLSGSYAETRGEDGRISGKADLAVSLDDYSAALQFEIGRGEGAQITDLISENTQTFTLDADTESMGYKLLAADAMALAASAAELYADPGVYGLMTSLSDDGFDWPEDLSDDIYNRYNRAYYSSWQMVYRFADAARIFEGNMPRYSEPENSVLTGIHAGAKNLVFNYMSNDGDFFIDITYLSDDAPVPTNPVSVSVEDFTFIEEDDMLMAYYCDGEYLVFFDFEKPDRARAEEIISGLMLASKKVGLSA